MGLGSADKGAVGTADKQQVTPESIGAEPTISPKRTAFNKDFGNDATTVAYGLLASQGLKSPLAGTQPNQNDVSAWPQYSHGFGEGTDGSIWLIYKKLTGSCWAIKLNDMVAPV